MTGRQLLLRAAGVAFASALIFMVLATLGDGSRTAQAAPAALVADIVGPGTGDADPAAKTVRAIVDDTVTTIDDTIATIDDTDDTVTTIDDTIATIDDTDDTDDTIATIDDTIATIDDTDDTVTTIDDTDDTVTTIDDTDDTVTTIDDTDDTVTTIDDTDDTVTTIDDTDDTVTTIDDTDDTVTTIDDTIGPGTGRVPPPAIDQVLPGVAPISPDENIPRPQTDSLPPVAPIEVDIAVTDSILEPVEIDTPAVQTLGPVEIDTPAPAVQTLEPAVPAASPGSNAIFALAVPAGYAGTVDHFISMGVSTGAVFPSPHAPAATPDPLPVRSTGLPGAPSLASGSHSGASSFSPDPSGSSALLAVLTATVAAMLLMSRRVTAEVSWRSVLVFSSIARPG